MGRDFVSWNKAAERGSPAGCKQDNLTAAGAQRGCGYEVIAWPIHEADAFFLNPLSVIKHIVDLRRAGFLDAAQTLFLQRGNAAGFVAGDGFS